jgi:hypothetical protein
MAPGFDPSEFALGSRKQLLARYPQRAAEILALTPQADDAG